MSDDTIWKEVADRYADLHAKAEARAEAAESERDELRAALNRGPAGVEAEINYWREREARLRDALEQIRALPGKSITKAYAIARVALEAIPLHDVGWDRVRAGIKSRCRYATDNGFTEARERAEAAEKRVEELKELLARAERNERDF